MDIMTVFPRRPSLENVQRVHRQCERPISRVKIVITQKVIKSLDEFF